MLKADLHIHTNASDGTLSSQEVVVAAQAAKLRYIAITDHDTMSGYKSLTPKDYTEISIIPGIEFSTDTLAHEIHVLGYYLDPENQELLDILQRLQTDRKFRFTKILAKLSSLGYKLDYEYVLQFAKNNSSLGRPHIAKALVACGYFPDIKSVFETVLSPNGPAYVPHFKLNPQDTIKLIKKAGGIPILAHPGLIGNDALVNTVIELGIAGLEVYHPQHNSLQIDQYLNTALSHHLLITGGSDFHGASRYPETIGIYTIPVHLLINFLSY